MTRQIVGGGSQAAGRHDHVGAIEARTENFVIRIQIVADRAGKTPFSSIDCHLG